MAYKPCANSLKINWKKEKNFSKEQSIYACYIKRKKENKIWLKKNYYLKVTWVWIYYIWQYTFYKIISYQWSHFLKNNKYHTHTNIRFRIYRPYIIYITLAVSKYMNMYVVMLCICFMMAICWKWGDAECLYNAKSINFMFTQNSE